MSPSQSFNLRQLYHCTALSRLLALPGIHVTQQLPAATVYRAHHYTQQPCAVECTARPIEALLIVAACVCTYHELPQNLQRHDIVYHSMHAPVSLASGRHSNNIVAAADTDARHHLPLVHVSKQRHKVTASCDAVCCRVTLDFCACYQRPYMPSVESCSVRF